MGNHPGPRLQQQPPASSIKPQKNRHFMSHGLSDEAVFRLQLDVKRLNAECRALRQRLGIPLDGRVVTLTVDTSVDTAVDTSTSVDNSVDKDRAAYQREWAAKRRAALKNKTATTDITA